MIVDNRFLGEQHPVTYLLTKSSNRVMLFISDLTVVDHLQCLP